MISAKVLGADELVAGLQSKGREVNESVVRKITEICIELQRRAKAKLSGQVLKVASGSLLRGLHYKVVVGHDHVEGVFMDTAVYAGAQEFGAFKIVTVKAHLRNMKMAFGSDIMTGIRAVEIKAHERRMNLPARSFLRSAMSEMEMIKKMLEDSVFEVIH